jgi:hypothetical protein
VQIDTTSHIGRVVDDLAVSDGSRRIVATVDTTTIAFAVDERACPMLNGKTRKGGVLRLTGGKGNDRTLIITVYDGRGNNGRVFGVGAGKGDSLPLKGYGFLIGTGLDDDGISILGGIDGCLDGGVIGRDREGGCKEGEGEKEETEKHEAGGDASGPDDSYHGWVP